MIVLGIESSCDETAAAVVAGARTLSNIVVSQIDIHKEYGGVVPELASRKHIEAISVVIEEALTQAGVSPRDLQGIGVTRGPGLIGSLLVGIGAAKGMALGLGLPIAGVNHLHGHLFAIRLERTDLRMPFIGLVVSGGHTSIYYVRDHFNIESVGKTRDDAAGEAFDKVAKLLNLGYPGGPVIEAVSRDADVGRFRFPRALIDKDNLDFSFSGLKTAVLRQTQDIYGASRRDNMPGSFHPLAPEVGANDPTIKALAAAFQEAVVDVLAIKTVKAAKNYGVNQIVICGGVAANGKLRERMKTEADQAGIEAFFPSMGLCTDNAAMVAARAHVLLEAGFRDELDFDAKSRW
jgi:N6-L-threonylcarbamoyladenine synthase